MSVRIYASRPILTVLEFLTYMPYPNAVNVVFW
ncbi:MAG: hypothetical protein RLZZ366_2163 [Pseudomonadota bacterium]|jgi:hypothetical protein